MKKKDVITNPQDAIMNVEKDSTKEIIKKEHHTPIINMLRKKTMTVPEIQKELEKSIGKKSKKSVYRYVKTLSDIGIIINAGKRLIINDEGVTIKTLNLYHTKAKQIFLKNFETDLNAYRDQLENEENINFNKALAWFLSKYFESMFDFDRFGEELLKEVFFKLWKNMAEMVDQVQYDKECMQFLSEQPVDVINRAHQEAGWVSLVLDGKEKFEEFRKFLNIEKK